MRYAEKYSVVAWPLNHHSTTSEKETPSEIHTADSIAASFVLTSCASRWNTSRSTRSRPTIRPSRTIHCHGWTLRSTKLPSPLSAASSEIIGGSVLPYLFRVAGAGADDRLRR